MLVARDLWFRYPGGGWVLRGASLALGPGEVVGVVGPTGSGKTTLLLLLAGVLRPERGEVTVDGLPAGSREARRLVGLVFQDPDDQLFNPTVYDEIAYALRSLGLPEAEVQERVERVASRLGIRGLLGRSPLALSHGQRRLVALASVLVYEPRYLLLDEPTAFLDPEASWALGCLVAEEARRGRGVLVTAHRVDELPEAARRVCLLESGRLRCLGRREAEAEAGAGRGAPCPPG